MTDGVADPYEELRVTNVSEFSALLSSVKLIGDTSAGTSLSGKSIAAGGSFGLVSGLPNGDGLSSDQMWWLNLNVCTGPDTASQGWIVKAAFSGEVENRTYTILCDGTVNGVPLSADDGTTTNNRKKRKRKQQAAARRKKRKKNKKDN